LNPTKPKPYPITKQQVWDAYKRVKANKGAAGVDKQTLQDFERDLENNLYKLWNRLASGSYMAPAVRRVEIPKANAGVRPLGIPTVADRIAQTVVRDALEPELERHFHPDSYGYRPGKSAHDALNVTRRRCWEHDWVLEYDIVGFFDNINHELLMKALDRHHPEKWVRLYIVRWLKAPVEMPDGSLQHRDKGTPQGAVISPLLANLFLHYTFDVWMSRHHPEIPFERYADDGVCHCSSLSQAQALKEALRSRFAECGLELHEQKTKIIYCKDDNRKGDAEEVSYDFLGYTFKPRDAKSRRGPVFMSFLPAISAKSATRVRQKMRSWKLQLKSGTTLNEMARQINPTVRGWTNYYGAFYKSALGPVLRHLDDKLVEWATRKHKRLRGHRRRAKQWLTGVASRDVGLFAHWRHLYGQAGGTGRAG
jgi:RNA-directed DNA polymerase